MGSTDVKAPPAVWCPTRLFTAVAIPFFPASQLVELLSLTGQVSPLGYLRHRSSFWQGKHVQSAFCCLTGASSSDTCPYAWSLLASNNTAWQPHFPRISLVLQRISRSPKHQLSLPYSIPGRDSKDYISPTHLHVWRDRSPSKECCQLPWVRVLQKTGRVNVRENHKAAKIETTGPGEGHSRGPRQMKGSNAKAVEVKGAQVVMCDPQNKVQPNCSLMNPLCANRACLLSKLTYPSPSCCSLGQDFGRRRCFNICRDLVFGPFMQLLCWGPMYPHIQL